MEEAMLAEDGILDLHLEAEQNMVGADSQVDHSYSYQGQVILYLSLSIALRLITRASICFRSFSLRKRSNNV